MTEKSSAPNGEGARTVRVSKRDLSAASRVLSLLIRGDSGDAEVDGSTDKAPYDPLYDTARRLLFERRQRRKYFNRAMFGEAAWDILILLYLARHTGSERTVVEVTRLIGAAGTTTIRWLRYLEKEKLIVRETHFGDKRALLIKLTDKGAERLGAYLADLA
jgi:DNA-binding MarR family transcriptional regulator